MIRRLRSFPGPPLLAILACSALPLGAQEEPPPPTSEEVEAARAAPLFATHSPLALTLDADFSAIKKDDRAQDSEERPAMLGWTEADGSTRSMEIQLRTRGNFRLARRNCDFPPLRLNVKKGEADGTPFQGQDKLKLVGVCKLAQSYWEQYVLLEYLAYRTFNLLTELGFRVRLARVTYTDTSGGDEPFTRYGFLIEDDADMAVRNGGRKIDWTSGQWDPRALEPNHATLVDVFQYMIGNTDWSGVEMHNMEMVRRSDGVRSTVPYDFDFSGLVSARYASPDPALPIRSVRDRLFRGFCPDQVRRSPEVYQATYALFRDKKEEIYALWRAQEGLEKGRLKDSLEYFDDFYDVLADEGRIQSRMMRSCRSLGR